MGPTLLSLDGFEIVSRNSLARRCKSLSNNARIHGHRRRGITIIFEFRTIQTRFQASCEETDTRAGLAPPVTEPIGGFKCYRDLIIP
jgi:hypothetical protein